MDTNLIIVESPNKIKTIKSYLPDNYQVLATYGHLREMDKKNGYDPKTFEPNWTLISDSGRVSKKKILSQIKNAASVADKIYLATDPDREGEAISWHIYDLLTKKDQKKCCRITFNEITKNAILTAIDNSHSIDMNLVYSQFARRVIDRLIGYKLSNLIRQKVRGSISAGRVQSVALMFIVQRQLERDAFVPSKWYEISAKLENGLEISYINSDNKFEKYNSKESSSNKFKFANENEARLVLSELSKNFKFIEFLPKKYSHGDKYQPLTTDKLLQLAGNSLGWGAAKTTLVAQKLFEGIEVQNQHIAFITYPRTDSTRLNYDFVKTSQSILAEIYGKQYLLDEYVQKKNKNENIQDAHEAIRPVDPSITPEQIKSKVDESSYKLYKLIWSRTMSCFMNVPEYETTGMIFDNNNHKFYCSSKKISHYGYLVLEYYDKIRSQYETKLPKLTENKIYLGDPILEEYDKQPPAYFTQASLIAALKESGVGRPSTYATMAKIGEDRGYVNEEKQKLIPTEIGIKVIQELKKDFSDVIDIKFTSQMENNLDKIASGDEAWTTYLNEFAPKFVEKLKEVLKNNAIERKNNQEMVGRQCPNCSSELVVKESRYGNKFVACSGFPKCRYAEFEEKQIISVGTCPECSKDLVKRLNKRGQEFVGCSGFPKCRYIKKD